MFKLFKAWSPSPCASLTLTSPTDRNSGTTVCAVTRAKSATGEPEEETDERYPPGSVAILEDPIDQFVGSSCEHRSESTESFVPNCYTHADKAVLSLSDSYLTTQPPSTSHEYEYMTNHSDGISLHHPLFCVLPLKAVPGSKYVIPTHDGVRILPAAFLKPVPNHFYNPSHLVLSNGIRGRKRHMGIKYVDDSSLSLVPISDCVIFNFGRKELRTTYIFSWCNERALKKLGNHYFDMGIPANTFSGLFKFVQQRMPLTKKKNSRPHSRLVQHHGEDAFFRCAVNSLIHIKLEDGSKQSVDGLMDSLTRPIRGDGVFEISIGKEMGESDDHEICFKLHTFVQKS